MSEKKFKVGQELWFHASCRSKRTGAVTITGIGRKWAVLSNSARMSMETMHVESQGYRLGHCYVSKAEWDETVGRDILWHRLRFQMNQSNGAPKGLSSERIKAAQAILFGEEVGNASS